MHSLLISRRTYSLLYMCPLNAALAERFIQLMWTPRISQHETETNRKPNRKEWKSETTFQHRLLVSITSTVNSLSHLSVKKCRCFVGRTRLVTYFQSWVDSSQDVCYCISLSHKTADVYIRVMVCAKLKQT